MQIKFMFRCLSLCNGNVKNEQTIEIIVLLELASNSQVMLRTVADELCWKSKCYKIINCC